MWVIDPTLAIIYCGAVGLGVLSVFVTVMASDRSLKRSCSWLNGSVLVQHNTRCPRPYVLGGLWVGGGWWVGEWNEPIAFSTWLSEAKIQLPRERSEPQEPTTKLSFDF